MRRILLIVLSCACVCFSTSATDESPSAWTAWLHYGRHMTLIDSNGNTLREVDLPVPDEYSLDRKVTISHDGNLIAYNIFNPQQPTQVQLYVYDVVNDQLVQTFILQGKVSQTSLYFPSMQMFSQNNTALAYGYAIFDSRTTAISYWQLFIFDLSNGQILYELFENDSVMTSIHDDHNYSIPIVRKFDETEVIFSLIGEINSYSFIWDMSSHSIRNTIAYPNSISIRDSFDVSDTFFQTDEVISPLYDDRFPPPQPGEPPLIPNSLHIYDPINHSRYPFFVNEDLPPYQADFVQNGQRVLVQSTWEWILVERDGTIIDQDELPHNHRTNGCRTTPTGCIYSLEILITENSGEPSFLSQIPAVYEVNTRDDKLDLGRVVWQIPMKEFHSYFDSPEQAYFDIAWVHSDEPVGPFKPWAQLAEPVYAPTPQPSDVTITPTLIPTPPPLFHVGQTVRVQTIDGEILNLRAEPTRKSEIVVYIEDETHLELLEGPVAAEGFSWWRVRLPDGLEGWVVENDGELQTLMPHSP